MQKTGQAMTVRSFGSPAEEGSIDDAASSRFLLANAEAAVSQALGPPRSGRGVGRQGETAGAWNNPHQADDHTLSGGVSHEVGSLPPTRVAAPSMVALHALQEWEGYVVSIDDDEFVARLVDLTAGDLHESEEATIPLEEISEYDARTMEVGSIFRWVIGYARSPEGTRTRVSQIVFRDLPRMTESDLRYGREWAEEIASVRDP